MRGRVGSYDVLLRFLVLHPIEAGERRGNSLLRLR